jgi:allantoin racemase
LKIKILDIIPVVPSKNLEKSLEDRGKLSKNITEESGGLIQLDIISIDKGTSSIESMQDEVTNTPYILEKIRFAEKAGYNAVVIDCFFDPGLDAAREIVKIPVIGPCHSACHLASQVGGRFSILTPLSSGKHIIEGLLRKYGLENNLASIRAIEIPVLGLETEPEKTLKRLLELSVEAVIRDGAYALVLGCTGMSWVVGNLKDMLRNKLGFEVPVIEPLRAAIYNAVMWVLYGITQSEVKYRSYFI